MMMMMIMMMMVVMIIELNTSVEGFSWHVVVFDYEGFLFLV